ncbi:Map microtubule affinity-regulating kinase [Physocladia obscura]|uniref:non-specific serine/threonine protein kinase n=1 Tax=Physocladia obscura TaxID=109957 RepID=A0AAD5XB45_9FUNG|nr:Map microtubule affinity-regulating kinase [Physocladia obscura]
MLVIDPKKRATLDQVKRDSWFSEGYENEDLQPVVQLNLSHEQKDQVLDELEEIGFEKSAILKALKDNTYDHMAATFFLTADRMFRKKSIDAAVVVAPRPGDRLVEGSLADEPIPERRNKPVESVVKQQLQQQNPPLPSIGSARQVKASAEPGLNTLNEDDHQQSASYQAGIIAAKKQVSERPTTSTRPSPVLHTQQSFPKRRGTTNGTPSGNGGGEDLKIEISQSSSTTSSATRSKDSQHASPLSATATTSPQSSGATADNSLSVPPVRTRLRSPSAQNRPTSFAGVPSSQIVPTPASKDLQQKTILESVSSTIQTIMPTVATTAGAAAVRKRATTIDMSSRERGGGGAAAAIIAENRKKDSDYSVASETCGGGSDSSLAKSSGGTGSPTKGGNVTGKNKPRTLRFTFSAGTTSSKDPDTLLDELERVLRSERIKYELHDGYLAVCKYEDDVEFEIEICKLPRLNLNGLRFKRMAGNSWTYKNLLTTVIEKLKL